MTRSVHPRPSAPSEPLAFVGVAIMVIHFYVRGHRDSWGSCRACQDLVDRIAPQYSSLRSRNTRGRGAGGSSARWNPEVLELVDAELFPLLVAAAGVGRFRYPVEAEPAGGFNELGAQDIEVARAAINEGRGFRENGLLGQVVCTPNNPATPHYKGTAEEPEECAHCLEIAKMLATALDRRAASAKGEERPGRLRAIARHTMYRANLANLLLTSPQLLRTEQGMPAKPDADLPDGIVLAIDERAHRGPLRESDERPFPTLVYLELIVELKWWALEVVNPTIEAELPVVRIGERLGLSPVEAEAAWDFIVAACSEVPKAAELFAFHLLDHLDRRLGGTALEVSEAICFARVQRDARDVEPSLLSEVRERLLFDLGLRPTEVTVDVVRPVLVEVLAERAASGGHPRDADHEVLDAVLEGDAAVVASLPGFDELVAEIVETIRGGDYDEGCGQVA